MELKPNLKTLNKEKKEILGKLTPQQVELMIEKKYSTILQNFPKVDKMEDDISEIKELIDFFDEKGISYIFHIRCGMIKALIDGFSEKDEKNYEDSIVHLSFYMGSLVHNIAKQLERIDEYLGQLFFFEYQSYFVYLHDKDGKVLMSDISIKRTEFIKVINGWIEKETNDLKENIGLVEDLIGGFKNIENLKGKENWKWFCSSLETYNNLKKIYDEMIEDGFKSFREIRLKIIKESFFENNPKAKEEDYTLKDFEWVKYDMENFRIIHKGEENFSDVSDFNIHLNLEDFFDNTECYNCTYKDEKKICCEECYDDEDWNHEKCLELCNCECEFCEDNPNNKKDCSEE